MFGTRCQPHGGTLALISINDVSQLTLSLLSQRSRYHDIVHHPRVSVLVPCLVNVNDALGSVPEHNVIVGEIAAELGAPCSPKIVIEGRLGDGEVPPIVAAT
jgi:hypothetical protein